MRIFSLLNTILLLLILATQGGGDLRGLLSASESHWLHAGAKVLLTGQLDADSIGFITKAAKQQMAAAMPINIQPQTAHYQPFNFSTGNAGDAMPAMATMPVNFTPPAGVDLDGVMTTVLSSLNS